MKHKKTLGIIFLVFTVLVWGITFLATETLLKNGYTPIEIMFFRFVLSFVVMLVCYPKLLKWQGFKVEALCFLASLLGMSIYQTLENVAIEYANGSMVSIIISTAAFFTAIFSRIILKKKIKYNFYFGFVISLAGIILVIINGNSLSIEPLGDIIAIFCAVLWGLYSVIIELLNRYHLNLVQATRRITMDCVIVLIPMFFISGGKFDIERMKNIENLLWIAYLGILASAIGFFTWNYSVDVLGSVPTSMAVLVQPIVTVVFGVIFFGHQLTWYGIIGVILTILGVYVALFLQEKVKETSQELENV